MKKYIGLVIAIIGILVLAYAIYIQAKTEESHIEYIVVGMGLNVAGVMYHLMNNVKRKSDNES